MPKGYQKEDLASQPGLLFGEPAGTRTQDTRIKSPVLYLLSYGLLAVKCVSQAAHEHDCKPDSVEDGHLSRPACAGRSREGLPLP